MGKEEVEHHSIRTLAPPSRAHQRGKHDPLLLVVGTVQTILGSSTVPDPGGHKGPPPISRTPPPEGMGDGDVAHHSH